MVKYKTITNAICKLVEKGEEFIVDSDLIEKLPKNLQDSPRHIGGAVKYDTEHFKVVDKDRVHLYKRIK